MAALSPEKFYRVSFAPESSFKVAGTYVHAKGLIASPDIKPGRETVAVDVALNSFGDRVGDAQGKQTYEASVSWFITEDSYTSLKGLLKAALGEEDAGGALTFNGAGTNSATQVATSSGTPSSVVRVTGDDGKKYICRVDTFNAGTSVLGTPLPTGVTPTDIDNPSALSGGCFDYLLAGGGTNGQAETFTINSDWANNPSTIRQQFVIGKGCAITSCKLVYEQGKLLALMFSFKGAEFLETGGASANISDPGRFTTGFLGWAGDWLFGAPSEGTGANYQINNGAGYAAGIKTVAVDTGTGTVLVGDTVTFGGVSGQYAVTAPLASGSFSFEPGLASAVADNAAVTLIRNPAWDHTKTAVKAIELEMAPPIAEDRGSNGLDGGSNSTSVLPGSDIKGFQRDALDSEITLSVSYDPRYEVYWACQKIHCLHGVMYPGTPNGAAIPDNRTFLSIKRIKPTGKPEVYTDGGARYHRLKGKIERDLTTNSIQERIHFGFVNAL